MKRLLIWTACSLFASAILAQNTTSATAAGVAWGQKIISVIDGGSSSQRWYRLNIVAGRSYCTETGNLDNTVQAQQGADTELHVFRFDGTTEIVGDDDTGQEPENFFLSRACWIQPVSSNPVFVKVIPHNASAVATVMVRFVETTLYCPWFFVAGDYNAFSLIRNTTTTTLSGVVVTWRGLNGAVAGTTTIAIPANGTVILNARDFINPLVFSNGSVEIAHTGSPEELTASTTTLSGTTGLGFDALFTQRKHLVGGAP